MIIVAPDTNTISFIPRVYEADTLIIRDEETNVVHDVPIDIVVVDRYYLQCTFDFTFIDNRYYSFKVVSGSDVVYRDKIFCTTQNPLTYNNGAGFISHTSDNTFIIRE